MKAKIKASENGILVRHCYPEIVDDMGLANTDPGLLDFVLESSLAILDFFARKAVTIHIDGESRSVKLTQKQKFRKRKQYCFNSGMLSEIIMFSSSKKRFLFPAKKTATLEIATNAKSHPPIVLIKSETLGKVSKLATRVSGLLNLPLTEKAAARQK